MFEPSDSKPTEDSEAEQVEVASEHADSSGELAAEEPIEETVELEIQPATIAPAVRTTGLSELRFAASPSPAASTPKGLGSSRFATSSPPPPRKNIGLAGSRFAASPSPVQDHEVEAVPPIVSPLEVEDATQQALPVPTDTLPPVTPDENADEELLGEPSMADIDAIMRHLNENPSMGVNRALDHQPQYHQPSPTRHIDSAAVTNPSPVHLPPQQIFRSDAPSPSPGRFFGLKGAAREPMLSTELEDPFIDPPHSSRSPDAKVHAQGSETIPESDWEAAFSEDEHPKLESRVNFFDTHVNGLVGGVLDAHRSAGGRYG